MSRYASVKIPLIINVILMALLAFELTSTFTFAEDKSTSGNDTSTQETQQAESKSLDELRDEANIALDRAKEAQSVAVTNGNEEDIKDKIYLAESALSAYVKSGGNEEDVDTSPLSELKRTYKSYTLAEQANSDAVTVGDVKDYLTEVRFPDAVFRNSIILAFEEFYSNTDWTDLSSVVKNNENTLADADMDAPITFTKASEVFGWWGGTMTLPAYCTCVDGIQYLGKDYYYAGNKKHEQTPGLIITTSDFANIQEFFGSTYGNSNIIIYVDLNASSMTKIKILGLNWDNEYDSVTTIPSFAHTCQFTFNMQQAWKADPRVFLRSEMDDVRMHVKTGMTVHSSDTVIESFGPTVDNSNPDTRNILDDYEVIQESDGWTIKTKDKNESSASLTAVSNDADMHFFMVPGVGSSVNKTFYMFKTTAEQSTVKTSWKTFSTTLGYEVEPKYVTSLDANMSALLYGAFTFKKTSSVTTSQNLAGAKYVVQNSEGKYLRCGSETSPSEFVDTLSLATKFETSDDGTFTAKNVPIGNVDDADSTGKLSASYTVTEIQAPAGYSLDNTPVNVTVTGDASGIAKTFDGGEGNSVSISGSNDVTYTPDFSNLYSSEPEIYKLIINDDSTRVEDSHDCYIANKADRGDGILGNDLLRIKYGILDSSAENYSTVQTPSFRLENANGETVLSASSLDELKTKINENLIYANAMRNSSDAYVIKTANNDPIIYYDNNSASTSVVKYVGDAQNQVDSPLPVNIKFRAVKNLQGEVLTDGQFKFTLKPTSSVVGDPVPSSGIVATNGTDGTILFTELAYAQPGTYTYTLQEVDESGGGRIHYDTTVHNVVVVVTEQADGLHATVNGEGNYTAVGTNDVTYNQGGQVVISKPAEADTNAVFKNYEFVNITGTKEWNDFDNFLNVRPRPSKNQFVNLIVYANDERMDPQPKVTWDYTDDSQGSWTYVISELPKYDEYGILIDYSVKEERVNNYKDAEIIRQETKENGDVEIDFKNSLDTGNLEVKKINSATGELADQTFEFTVTLGKPNGGSYNGATYVLNGVTYTYDGPIKLNLKGGESAVIKDILAGASYVVSETKADGFNQTSDKAGIIVADTTVEETITNTPVTTALQFDKTVVDASGASSDEEFTFTIKVGKAESSMRLYSGDYIVSGEGVAGEEHVVGDAPNSITVNGEKRTTTNGKVTIKKNQTVTFAAQTGDNYHYEITEDATGAYTTMPAVAEGTSSSSTIEHFSNVHKLPESADVVIDVEKLLFTPTWSSLTKQGFEFLLTGSGIPTKATATLATSNGSFKYDTDTQSWNSTPSGTVQSYTVDYTTENISETAKSDADGKARFSSFKIAKAGDYTFKVKEVVPEAYTHDMTYDTREITVKVKVEAEEGTNKLKSTVTYYGGETGNAEDGSLPRAFKNVQNSPSSVSVPMEITKFLNEAPYKAGDFSFTRRDVSSDLKDGVERTPDETVTNSTDSDASGNSAVKFSNIEYAAPGTYTYEITENKGSDSAINYSSEKITVVVAIDWVVSETQNELKATSVTYENSSGGKNNVISNKFSQPTDPEFSLEVSKSLFLEGTDTAVLLKDGQFEFGLFDADGNAVKNLDTGKPFTATCDENGKVTFSSAKTFDISYNAGMENGESNIYDVYTIREIKSEDSSIATWDNRTVTAKVYAWRNKESNEIEYRVTYTGGSGDASNTLVNEQAGSLEPVPEGDGEGGANNEDGNKTYGNSDPVGTFLAKTGGTIVPIIVIAQIALACGIAIACFRKKRDE